MNVIEAFELYRFYHSGEDETLALRGVSLRVGAGELVAVMGPSGSGKSTLLACLAGLDEPDGGHVELMGQRLTRRAEPLRAQLRARHIGIVLQAGNLFQHLTLAGNVCLQMMLARKGDRQRIEYLVDLVGLRERRDARPSELSGGEAARAGLAVALAAAPELLLADEPTAEVDAETEEQILALLDERRGKGGAALIATHSVALARRADRIVEMQDGRVIHG
jgi:putative ABC transport system ATP-binding protein